MKPDPEFGKKTTDQIWEARAAATEKLGRATIEAIIQAAHERFCESASDDPFASIKTPPRPRKAPVHRKRNEYIDALASACGGSPEHMTQMALRTVAVAWAEIKTVSPDCTCEEIRKRVSRYRSLNPTWPCTASAVAKNWDKLGVSLGRTESAKSDVYTEPTGWMAVAQRIYPEADFTGRAWNDVPVTLRSEILRRTT